MSSKLIGIPTVHLERTVSVGRESALLISWKSLQSCFGFPGASAYRAATRLARRPKNESTAAAESLSACPR